jgi:hypothetical protein
MENEIQKDVQKLNHILAGDHSSEASASSAAIEKIFSELYAHDKSSDKHTAFKESSEILKELKSDTDKRPMDEGAHLAVSGVKNDWYTIVPEALISVNQKS